MALIYVFFTPLIIALILFYNIFELDSRYKLRIIQSIFSMSFCALFVFIFVSLSKEPASILFFVLLAVSCLLGGFLFQYMYKHLKNKLLKSNRNNETFFVQMAHLLAKPSEDINLLPILKSLNEVIGFESALLLTEGTGQKLKLQTLHAPVTEMDTGKLQALFRLIRRSRLSNFSGSFLNQTIVLSGEKNILPAELKHSHPRFSVELERNMAFLSEHSYQIVLPMVFRNEFVGFIILGPKQDGLAYLSSELEFLQGLRLHLAALVKANHSFEELTDKTRQAQDELSQIVKFSVGEDTVQRALDTHNLVYKSQVMAKITAQIRDVAKHDYPVLFNGETGTGKELAALLLHDEGRKERPFIPVNCAAIPESLWESEIFGHKKGAFTGARQNRPGKIEEAAEGTLFFDEIGEMPLLMQSKMLRLLQENTFRRVGENTERKAGCQFVFATNRNLQSEVEAGHFRADLRYRINTFTIELPPLRERREDIPVMVEYYLRKFNEKYNKSALTMEQATLDLICKYDWPGNIRELVNCIIRTMAGCREETIRPIHLPENLRPAALNSGQSPINGGVSADSIISTDYPVQELEPLVSKITRLMIEDSLVVTGGNKSQAAARLGLTRGKLLYRIKELGLIT